MTLNIYVWIIRKSNVVEPRYPIRRKVDPCLKKKKTFLHGEREEIGSLNLLASSISKRAPMPHASSSYVSRVPRRFLTSRVQEKSCEEDWKPQNLSRKIGYRVSKRRRKMISLGAESIRRVDVVSYRETFQPFLASVQIIDEHFRITGDNRGSIVLRMIQLYFSSTLRIATLQH